MSQTTSKEVGITLVYQTGVQTERGQQTIDLCLAIGQRRVQLVARAVQLNFRDDKSPRPEPWMTDLCCRITALTVSQNAAGAARNLAVVGLKSGGVCGQADVKTAHIPFVVARHNLRRTVVGRGDG